MSFANLISVERLPVEALSLDVRSSFVAKERPVVIEGGCKTWPAFKKWGPEFFATQYGDVAVPLSNYKADPYQRAQTKPEIPIKEYLKQALMISKAFLQNRETESEYKNLYSAGWFFCNGYCELLKDLETPKCFSENWAEKVQKVVRFETKSILFGHPKVESPLHTDSFFVSTYFAMIRGQKRMRLVSPEYSQFVGNGYNVFDEEKVAELQKRDVPVWDCVIREGDLVWFPPGWWHHVKNDTFTISITTNFVSEMHILPFEQQVRATLIKPLLNLIQLKKECLARGPIKNQSLAGIKHSQFNDLERRYVNHFKKELEQTAFLIDELISLEG